MAANLPRQLTYAFPCTLSNSGGDSYTFSLTLSRQALENADRVVVIYSLRPDQQIETNASPNSLGVLRGSVIEEFPTGPSMSQALATRGTRYTLAFDAASGYDTNPRNLEALWKPVYKTTLYSVIDGMDSCDVLEEDPVWVFFDAKDAMPLNRTVAMSKGGGKTVYPDLSIVMWIGTTIVNHRLSRTRFLPVIVELKRAISRKLTVHGYPDFTKQTTMNRLIISFGVGQKQLEFTAFLHLKKVLDQSGIIMLVGVGPWFRALAVTRQDVFQSKLLKYAKLPETIIEDFVNQQLENMVDAAIPDEDANDAAQGQNQQDGTPPLTFEGFKEKLNSVSFLSGWSEPVMIGTPEATRVLNLVRAHLHSMMSTGYL